MCSRIERAAGQVARDRRGLGGLQHRDPRRHGLGQLGRHRVEPGDGVVPGGPCVAVTREGVGDQQHGAVGVVQHGQVGDQHQRELGHPEVVGAGHGQPLQPPDHVVAQVADEAAGERGQVGGARGSEPAAQRPDGGQRVLRQLVGQPRQRSAQPLRDAVALGQDPGAAHADKAVPRPLLALLGRLQQHGVGPVAGELPVDPDRRLAVGQQPAHDRDDRLIQRGELLPGRAGDAEPHEGRPSTAASGRWKQLRSPVWQAGPSWSTRTSSASPSQSSRTSRTHWRCPDVSPFTQYSPRLRDQ
jgi:hypothetical protein